MLSFHSSHVGLAAVWAKAWAKAQTSHSLGTIKSWWQMCRWQEGEWNSASLSLGPWYSSTERWSWATWLCMRHWAPRTILCFHFSQSCHYVSSPICESCNVFLATPWKNPISTSNSNTSNCLFNCLLIISFYYHVISKMFNSLSAIFFSSKKKDFVFSRHSINLFDWVWGKPKMQLCSIVKLFNWSHTSGLIWILKMI